MAQWVPQDLNPTPEPIVAPMPTAVPKPGTVTTAIAAPAADCVPDGNHAYLEGAINGLDAFAAGLSNVITFGWSNVIREQWSGSIATQNHHGGLYYAGAGSGIGIRVDFKTRLCEILSQCFPEVSCVAEGFETTSSVALGFGGSGALAGSGWAVSSASGYTTFSTVYAFGQSS